MSIEIDERKYYLQCDFCCNNVDEFEVFADAVIYKRTHNWVSIKEKGEWFDKCPTCQEL